ncbi:MAG TPA: HAD-IA family hydrolase [Acidimicrobiales bacterium]|nr:HAD-IA family hydrolase [Acidimicrobiales bacterium]
MIKATLFDFGGVILSSPFEAFSSYERANGLPDGFIRGVNATNPHDNAWARLERGEVDLEQFCALFEEESAAAGHRVAGMDVIGLLSGEVRPQMVEALRRCRERVKTACLTNNFVLAGEEDTPGRRAEVEQVMSLFDLVVESSKVGVRKPDPRFYEMACEGLGIEPSEAVFLDDLGINLKPAREMGMTTIKVSDPDVAIADLERVLGFPLG